MSKFSMSSIRKTLNIYHFMPRNEATHCEKKEKKKKNGIFNHHLDFILKGFDLDGDVDDFLQESFFV